MSLPPLGGHAPPILCSRLLHWPDEDSRCPSDATHHVIWNEEGDNGLVCELHRVEAVKWAAYAIHVYRMECSMPAAVFLHDENICVVDEGSLGLSDQLERTFA